MLVALAECEQVDLVVARNPLSLRIEYQRCAAHPHRIGGGDRHGAADQPQLLLARHARQKVLLQTVAVGLARIHLVGGARAEDAEVLGQQDQRGALLPCRDDQRLDRGQVRLDVAAGDRLHRGHAHALGAARGAHCGAGSGLIAEAAAGAGGNLPSRSTTGSDQLPVTA